jgi:glucose/arabinose dehydrogenase
LVVLAVIGLATCPGCIRLPFGFVPVVEDQGEIALPAGFVIGDFATGLSDPRFMVLGPGGVVLVAQRGINTVTALPDRDGDGVADEALAVVGDLDAPTSLAFRDGRLHIGETSRLTRVDLSDDLVATNRVVLIDDLPTGGHATRTVVFGSDGKIYVSIGSSCNVCVEADPPPGGGQRVRRRRDKRADLRQRHTERGRVGRRADQRCDVGEQ